MATSELKLRRPQSSTTFQIACGRLRSVLLKHRQREGVVPSWSGQAILGLLSFDFKTIPQRVSAIKKLDAGLPRGRALESLVGEMFGSLPGVDVVDSNVVSGSGEAEIDILLSNSGHEGGLPAFDRDVILEIKSSGEAMIARDVTHFVTQIKRRGLRWSIIVALEGLTGDGNAARAAHFEIQDAAGDLHGVILFVESELGELRSTEHLAAVVERKRQKMVGTLRAVTFSPEEIRRLDPNRYSVDYVKGAEGIRQAVRIATRVRSPSCSMPRRR